MNSAKSKPSREKGTVVAGIFFIACMTAFAASAGVPLDVIVGSGETECGLTLDIPIAVSGASSMSSFGMTLTFDAGNITFLSAAAGTATSDWLIVTGNETTPGTVILDGLRGTGTVLDGSGELIVVTLRCDVCTSTTDLNLSNLLDGVAGAAVTPGTATCENPPELTVAPTSRDVGDAGGTTNFVVSNAGGGELTWSASESCDWVSLSGASGTNSGMITATFSENTDCEGRTCSITVTSNDGTETVTLTQAANIQAFLSVAPSETSVSNAAGSTTYSVSNTGCGTLQWVVVETCTWVTLSPTSGTGDGSFIATFTENTGCGSRTCVISIESTGGPTTVTLTQAGRGDLILDIGPVGPPKTSDSGIAEISVDNIGCGTLTWSASEACDWVTLSSASGTGSGTIIATFDANPDCVERSCAITVTSNGGTQTATLTQNASTTPILSVTPESTDVGAEAGSTTYAVENVGCGFLSFEVAADEDSHWVSVFNLEAFGGEMGPGGGTIVAEFTENTNIFSRTCTISVFSSGPTQTITLTQAASEAASVLYGASPGCSDCSATDSNLYTIDPATGDANLVGPIGFENVTGLADVNGRLLGTASADELFVFATAILIEINPATGEGSLIGVVDSDVDSDCGRMPGLTFDLLGQILYAYGARCDFEVDDGLYTIDTVLGTGTYVGATGFSGNGRGLAIEPATGTIFATPDDVDSLVVIDPLTGAGTSVAGSEGNVPTLVNALAFEPATGALFGSQKENFEVYHLVVIDTADGLTSIVGETVLGLDALVFFEIDIPGPAGAGDPKSSDGCFIATAAYGTPMADQLGVLRAVRDDYLLTSPLGTAFVDTYYRVSPSIADVVALSPTLASLVSLLLVPVIVLAQSWLLHPLAFSLAVLSLCAMVAYRGLWLKTARSTSSE